MRQVILACCALCLLLGLTVARAAADDCQKCDCIHLPCPKECKPCCGLSSGMIAYSTDDRLTLHRPDGASSSFKITHNTKIVGDIAKGHTAKVYFKNSGADKLAEKVVVSDK